MDLSLNVLVVEDDEAMAQMCAKVIRRRGHSAVIAESCQDAVAIVRAGREIDAVISDVHMPQMSGIELLVQLQELNAQLPVILMTGYTNIASANEAAALGAADYLSKPFDPETLIGSIERSFLKRVPEHA
jgi:DNA-binding NtrC family response regulator